MGTSPQTWNVLQSIQWLVFNNLQVVDSRNPTPGSPFSVWSSDANPTNPGSASDATRFGTNPYGTVTTAVYPGWPKDAETIYDRQCHVILPNRDMVTRHAVGGKVWHEAWFYVRFLYEQTEDWLGVDQDMMAAYDVMHPLIMHQAQMPNAASVIATKEAASSQGYTTGFHYVHDLGRDWVATGYIWWARQEYMVSGGFVP